MEKLIWHIRRKPQISTTANVRSKFTLRERLKQTPEPHSRNPIISPELIEKLLKCYEILFFVAICFPVSGIYIHVRYFKNFER